MSLVVKDVPIGIKCLQYMYDTHCPYLSLNRELWYRLSVLVLTYLTYMCHHMSRKPLSVTKNELHHHCENRSYKACLIYKKLKSIYDWYPFDGSDCEAIRLLGILDSVYLFSYAIMMFISGYIADRVNIRYFLVTMMFVCAFSGCLFGFAKIFNIHNFGYFVFVQFILGIGQSAGWPCVIAVMGYWFGKIKKGFFYGVWKSNTSVGNMLGSLIAGAFVESNWSLSFIVPGLIMGGCGIVVCLFLVKQPSDVDCLNPKGVIEIPNTQHQLDERTPTTSLPFSNPDKAIGFFGALKIPGVVEFSFSLFFIKLISYTFLFWLPYYINTSTTLGVKNSAILSIMYDVGGIFGAILAGIICDLTDMYASTCAGMLLCAAPIMFLYQRFGPQNLAVNIILLGIVGSMINGPDSVITTAVSADLGTHSSLEGNAKALATVTAIIDGTGSIGAAVGPLLAGIISDYGWSASFYMLMVCDLLGVLLLTRLVIYEIQKIKHRRIT